MTAAVDVIKGALEKLGAHSEPLNPAPPETLNRGVTVLSSLLDELAGEQFQTGVISNPTAQSTELNEAVGVTEALEYLLMYKLSPVVQKPVLPDAHREAQRVIRLARERFQYMAVEPRRTRSTLTARPRYRL